MNTTSDEVKVTDWHIIEAMTRYGGGFIKHLALACKHADLTNLRRIKNAFPEEWTQYATFAERDMRSLQNLDND